MCTNWRRLGSILADVTENALMEAMQQDGAAAWTQPLNVPPPRSAHRDALRLEWNSGRQVEATRPPLICGTPANAMNWKNAGNGVASPAVVREGIEGNAPHSLLTSRDSRRVFSPHAEEAPASALRRSMLVVVHAAALKMKHAI
jgi:hypothetical protein